MRIAIALGLLLLLAGAVSLLTRSRGSPQPAEAGVAPADARRVDPAPAHVERGPERVEADAPDVPEADVGADSGATVLDPPAEPGEAPADLCRLRGTLLDVETKAPLPGYRIELLPVFGRSAARFPAATDDAGVFELEVRRGEYLVMHRTEAGLGERALARELTPSRLDVEPPELDDGGGVPLCETTFLARRPPESLEVEVTYEDGRPAVGAVVTFVSALKAEPLVDIGNRTDERGRVRLGVWEPREVTDGQLTAVDGEGNVSEVLAIESPFAPGLRRLVLAPGGELAVHVRTADGSPVAGRRILLASELRFGQRLYEQTDEVGDFRFDSLFAGAYVLDVWLSDGSGRERRPVEIARGERRALDVVLPRPSLPVAAAGMVLDQDGRPLAGVVLGVTLDGRRAGTVRTDETGAFRFRAEGGERVWVGANVVQKGDLFDPPHFEVPFGSADLVFLRRARTEPRTFEVEVYDRSTGAELKHFVAAMDRGPGTEMWCDFYSSRRRFELRPLPDVRWIVKSSGYVERELRLRDELDRLAEGQRLRIGLDPGLDHLLQVRDVETWQPIPGVVFTSETAGRASTDASGRVRLLADHWSVYRVRKEGYATEDWDPEVDLLWGRGTFAISRE